MPAQRLDPATDEERSRIGQALRAQRKSAGLSCTELAARMGVSYSYLGNVETARRRPTPEFIARAAEVLGIDTTDLTEPVAA